MSEYIGLFLRVRNIGYYFVCYGQDTVTYELNFFDSKLISVQFKMVGNKISKVKAVGEFPKDLLPCTIEFATRNE